MPFFLVQERHLLHEGFLNCQRGIWESSGWHAIFSNTFHLRYSLFQNVNGPCRRAWEPTPVFLPEEFHGQRSLMSCSPRSHQESDTREVTEHAGRHIKMWMGSSSWALSPSKEIVLVLHPTLATEREGFRRTSGGRGKGEGMVMEGQEGRKGGNKTVAVHSCWFLYHKESSYKLVSLCHVLHLRFTITLWDRCSYNIHSTNEPAEA